MWGRFRRWPRLTPLVCAILALATAVWMYARGGNQSGVQLGAFSRSIRVARTGPCEVVDVLDAATLVVRQPASSSGGQEFVGSVRLLGIVARQDTAAVEFTRQAVKTPFIRLDLDKRRVDREGNYLAYVYVGDKHLSEELVTAGLARVHTYPGDSMTINRQLLKAQDQARIKQVGIWAPGAKWPALPDDEP